jgi:hypothetical protein
MLPAYALWVILRLFRTKEGGVEFGYRAMDGLATSDAKIVTDADLHSGHLQSHTGPGPTRNVCVVNVHP